MHSFRCLTDSDFGNFPKSCGVTLDLWESIGYVSSHNKLYKFKDVELKDNQLSNIMDTEQVEPEDIILHIRELSGFKDILNWSKRKITSVTLIGVLKDGRGVFKASDSLTEYDFRDVLKIFYTKYRLL
ncbi:hypothetical protein MZM54_01605 [[Brevibacterium] frigoritolerans]|nr:hypothetical protein [Peribacillus frigoritolerans]